MKKGQRRHEHKGLQRCEKGQAGPVGCGRAGKGIQCSILKRLGKNPDPQASESDEETASDKTHRGLDKGVASAMAYRRTEGHFFVHWQSALGSLNARPAFCSASRAKQAVKVCAVVMHASARSRCLLDGRWAALRTNSICGLHCAYRVPFVFARGRAGRCTACKADGGPWHRSIRSARLPCSSAFTA